MVLRALAPLEARGIVALTIRKKLTVGSVTISKKLTVGSVNGLITSCRKRSFCPFAHFQAAYFAIRNLELNCNCGDVVLCGVARGGLARFLRFIMPPDWDLWLYDTFDGGSLPGLKDGKFEQTNGAQIKRMMATDFAEVKRYVEAGTPGRIHWVVGDVMKTIPKTAPTLISLLYLDTDYYDSTLHELKHLDPRVRKGGVIIQDDMGLCIGARRAVFDYYAYVRQPLFCPIDEAGSVWVKS